MKIIPPARKMGVLLKDTTISFFEREPFRNSAVIAYYTIFSLPGLFVIIINLAGYFFGEEAVTNRISQQIQGLVGGSAAKDIESIIANASGNKGITWSSLMGLTTLLFGATGVFYQLQQILNLIWEVKPQPKQKIIKLIMDRIFSFGLILVVGFLLLVSLMLSAALSILSEWVAAYLSDTLNILFKILDFSISLVVTTLLFGAIFKFLPDAQIRWKDVWVGALMTAILFVVAKIGLGIYFANSDPASTYGAAGSIILIMLWVTYAGLILLFGAEFTRMYAERYGVGIVPSEYAISTRDLPEDKTKNPPERKPI